MSNNISNENLENELRSFEWKKGNYEEQRNIFVNMVESGFENINKSKDPVTKRILYLKLHKIMTKILLEQNANDFYNIIDNVYLKNIFENFKEYLSIINGAVSDITSQLQLEYIEQWIIDAISIKQKFIERFKNSIFILEHDNNLNIDTTLSHYMILCQSLQRIEQSIEKLKEVNTALFPILQKNIILGIIRYQIKKIEKDRDTLKKNYNLDKEVDDVENKIIEHWKNRYQTLLKTSFQKAKNIENVIMNTENTQPLSKKNTHGASLNESVLSNNYEKSKTNPVICDGVKKAFYHSNKYCSCDFETLAEKLTAEIQLERKPLDRLIRCIQGREFDFALKIKQGRGYDVGHKKIIDKLWDLYYGLKYWLDEIIDEETPLENIEVKYGQLRYVSGYHFYIENTETTEQYPLLGYFDPVPHGGKRRQTRKASQKKRKQTRRIRA